MKKKMTRQWPGVSHCGYFVDQLFQFTATWFAQHLPICGHALIHSKAHFGARQRRIFLKEEIV